jgi:TonB-linked SusC/RagA family outer membrane protein
VPGLNIGASNNAGEEPDIQIRGQNSINGDNSPLIVLDGVIYLGNLGDINSNDIATFDILKDAASAAAYGSRSANGVIAITTKKGKTGKPIITLNTSIAAQTWQNQPVLMKGEEYLTLCNDRSLFPEGTTSWMKTGELANYEAGNETDWVDLVTRTGVVQKYQLSVSGASDKVNYYLSAGYNANKGIILGDDFSQVSLLGKVNTTITNWLKIGLDANFSRRDYSGFAANVGLAQEMHPYGVLYRDDYDNLEKYPYAQGGLNPLWGIDDGTRENIDVRNNYRLNAYALIDVPWVKGLNYRINVLTNLDNTETGDFYNEGYYILAGEGLERYEPDALVGLLSQANGYIDHNKTFSYVFDNVLNYKKTIGDHDFDITAVATRDYSRYQSVNSSGSDFSSNGNTALGIWGLGKATYQKVVMDIEKQTNIGYLGRISYSFNDKYFVTSSYRRDGASVFGANKKWGNFASAGAAWKVSNENFMKDFEPLDYLKLKLSWGQNGNQGISAYETLSTIANSSSGEAYYEFYDDPGTVYYGLYQEALGNSDLGWESTDKWNTGFESAWLSNRLFVNMDVYFSQTKNQIFARNIPVMTGFKTVLTSLGQVNNSGIELEVRTVNLKNKELEWNTTLTFWRNRNELVELYGEDNDGDGIEDDDIANSLFIGEPLGAIFGYEQDGIVQLDDAEYIALTGSAPGSPKYKDIDGVEGITADDRKILGYDTPNFYLNMGNTLSYKGFDLYVLVSGIFGGDNYYLKSNTAAFATNIGGRANDNMTARPYWTEENPSNVYPSAYFSGDGRYLALQSRGFVRVQDISLSYTFNQNWVKRANVQALKLFFSAKNVATFTSWEGGDPETGTTVRYNTFPVPSTYSIGANISF